MTGLEKWKDELIKAKYKQIKEIEEMSVDKAVTLIDIGLDCSRCIYYSEDEYGNKQLSHECDMRHHIETCRTGIKAYLDMEVEE